MLAVEPVNSWSIRSEYLKLKKIMKLRHQNLTSESEHLRVTSSGTVGKKDGGKRGVRNVQSDCEEFSREKV